MPERNYPQYPIFDKPEIKKILYGAGLITRESRERPLSERMDRAEFLKKYFKTDDKEKRKDILKRASELDKTYVQFLQNQQEVKININGLGEQTARYIVLEPSKPSDKPPIILLPGISNDLEGVGELPIKLAASGRKVVEIAYPESWHGKVTKEFGDAVKKSNSFEPHTEFFKKAINQIIGENIQIDLWGVSTGSVISANLLRDKEFKKRIDNAALMVPPGEIDHDNFNAALVKESLIELKKIWLIPKLSVVNSKKINTSDEHRRLMLHTHEALKEHVLSRYDWWIGDLKTGTGNKAVVVIGDQDYITEAIKKKNRIEFDKKVKLYCIKGGNHSTPSVESDDVISLINYLQKSN